MFSGRNNIFLWATGWSFSTFNTFHRHVARIAVFEAIVHSVGWSVLEAKGNPPSANEQSFVI
jgi:ferric-chelate reductase